MEIKANVTLKYEPLQPTRLRFPLKGPLEWVYVTPETTDVRLDFCSSDFWSYVARIFDNQVDFFKIIKGDLYKANVPIFTRQPKIEWKQSTIEDIDIGENETIEGLCNQTEYKGISVNGRKYDLEFNLQDKKLALSLNLPTTDGAPKNTLYSLTFGSEGVEFARVQNSDYQTLQQIVNPLEMGIVNPEAPMAPKPGDLVWRERPFIDPGYDRFILDLD